MAKTSGTLSVYPTRVDPHHGNGRRESAFKGTPNPVILPRHPHHQHPEWRLDPSDEVDWGAFGGQVVDASYSVLPNLHAISMAPTFECLTVLSVRASGLISIDLLQSCSTLVHLDLSSNKITHLGDGDFWASFRHLLVILLHGNLVTEWQAVGSLGKAPQLTYLTLFSNPVSMKKAYRAFTANCCEYLLGLDLHAVSDEEVVEGSPFCEGSRWKTCSSALALPQPLFKGLTEVALDSARDECAETGRSVSPLKETKLRGDCHPTKSSPRGDARVVSSVSRRVELLRKFHARNSPVIIVQRQVRRYICHQAVVAAAVRIQSCVRRWMVKLQATNALQLILRKRGELHLVQEILTPAQLRSLSFFQRRIAGHFRMKMLVTCTQTLERFMSHVARRFSSFVARLDRAQVGGVVVASDAAGELAAAVTKALMVMTTGLSWDEAAERAVEMITTVANCRLLRPFSYNDVPTRLALEKDVKTDGIFVTRSPTGSRLRAEPRRVHSRSFSVTRTSSPTRPFSGLREPKRDPQVRRKGVFGSPRVTECIISRRNSPVRRFSLDRVEEGDRGGTGMGNLETQLWIFRPTETCILARVLRTLRTRSVAKHPVPYILERHLFRCAAATRLQAAWRGHVLRWNLVDTLASCLIVARAGVCIQRWWRYQTGLGARLSLCRRLWALTSAVSSPTMFMELDVFFTLTRGWRWPKDKDNIVFSFESGDRVAIVKKSNNGPFGAFEKDLVECGEGKIKAGKPEGCAEKPACRELPLWTRESLVRELISSDVQHRQILRHVGALVTEGVIVKRVVWPVAATAVAGASEPTKESSTNGSASYGLTQVGGDDKNSMPLTDTDIWVASKHSEVSGESSPGMTQKGVRCEDSGPPVDLGRSHGDIDMLELTFCSVQEARARATLLALATEEPGVLANRPIAQLMTLGMLRRAAAGKPGQASPTPKKSVQVYDRGDAVEVSVLKLYQGYGGAWLPGKVYRQTGNGTTYTVALDNGRVEQNIPDDRLRPLDRTGIELALVGMSHLPSRWQRTARSLLTPTDRLELELLRRSLPTTTPVEYSEGGPPQLLREGPPHEAGAIPAPAGELPHNFDGLSGRGISLQPRLHSPGSPAGRDDTRLGPPPIRWAGSQTMSAAKSRGGGAVGDLEKVARAAAAEDEATAASTWIPGNRFRRDLEKLVQMATRDSQDASKERELSARRENVCRVRNVERGGPSPRDRLEALKAADVAIFRRESDALKDRSASEKARDEASRAVNVATVKGSMREGKQLARLWVEDRQEKQIADVRKRENEVEVERHRQLEKRQADVAAAKARATQRQAERSKKALYVAESNAFTANTSQLARYVGKYATMSHKSQNARGMRQWVKGKKVHEEDTRRRMLRRVQQLQEQKRSEALRLRRVLAARGKARVAMDEAIVRHRLGTLTSPGSGLADDVVQVLRPSGHLQRVPSSSGKEFAFENSGTLSPWRDENDENDGVIPREAFLVGELDDSVPHRETTFDTAVEVGKTGNVRPAGAHRDVDGDTAAAPLRVALPSKPENPRSRCHQQQRNRRLRANDAGKTVVVRANVPTVAVEQRPRSSPGTGGALFGRPKSGHAKLSLVLQRGLDYKARGVQMTSAAPSDKDQLPWPLGRRCL